MERPGRTPETERQPGAPGSRILAELPAPIEAGEKLLTVLDGELMKMLERTQGLGRAIDQDTARVIAYALIARAPEGAPTGQLQQLLDTGTGNHDSLKAEYLPLRALPDTTFDQRLLIDALGTRLAGSTAPPPQTRAARYAHITTIEVVPLAGEPVDVLFKSPVEIGPLGATALTMRFLRLHREHGDAFLAYLRSPGVTATWQDIDGRFRAAYIGGPDALAAVQEAPDSTDPVLWHAVEIGGHTYVFHA